jgi:hypothetical protein
MVFRRLVLGWKSARASLTNDFEQAQTPYD